MDDGDDSLLAVRRIAWWIADFAAWVSISFSVVAHGCHRFVDHHRLDMTATERGFVVQVGDFFGYVAIGWIVISAVLAITCRVRFGIAKETSIYLALLLLTIIACGTLPAR
jgi:hypothetical protein